MVPPFMAYYGVTTRNRTLLVDAYNQIRLYRSYLCDPDADNLWKHIVLGVNASDLGHWSTGKVYHPPAFEQCSQSSPFRKCMGSSRNATRPRDHPKFRVRQHLEKRTK